MPRSLPSAVYELDFDPARFGLRHTVPCPVVAGEREHQVNPARVKHRTIAARPCTLPESLPVCSTNQQVDASQPSPLARSAVNTVCVARHDAVDLICTPVEFSQHRCCWPTSRAGHEHDH